MIERDMGPTIQSRTQSMNVRIQSIWPKTGNNTTQESCSKWSPHTKHSHYSSGLNSFHVIDNESHIIPKIAFFFKGFALN